MGKATQRSELKLEFTRAGAVRRGEEGSKLRGQQVQESVAAKASGQVRQYEP